MSEPAGPHAELAELTRRLSGRWRVSGPGIAGLAEYRPVNDGLVLVGDVDFVVNGTPIKNIQRIAHDRDADRLRAQYLDTAGDDSCFTWVLDGESFRVVQDGADSDTYFEGTFADDGSSYTGTWHYPPGQDDGAADEWITYTRIT